MQVMVSGKHVDVGEALRTRVTDDLIASIGKYFGRGGDAEVVVSRDGTHTQLATWVADPGHTATPTGSISIPVDQIAAVQVVSADNGKVLLERSL